MEKSPARLPDITFNYTLPGPTPEATPAPTHTELLAQHVDEVRRNGNAIDHIWTYKIWPSAAASIPPSLTAGALLAAERIASTSGGILMVSPFVLGAVATAVTGARIVKPRLQRRADQQDTSRYKTQREIGEWYDLWPIGRKKNGTYRGVAMQWYGPHDHFEQKVTDSGIMRIATLAKEAGVSELIIGEGMLQTQLHEDTPIPGRHTTMHKWLRRYRKQYIGGDSNNEKVMVATPAGWQDYVRNKKQATDNNEDKKYNPLYLDAHHPGVSILAKEMSVEPSGQGMHLYFPATATTKHPVSMPTGPAKEQPTTQQHKDRLTIQDQLGLGRRPGKKDKSRVEIDPTPRMTSYALGAVVCVALSTGAHSALNDRMDTLEHQATAQIVAQHGADPKTVDVDPLAAREEVASWHNINKLVYRWQDAQDQVYRTLESFGSDSTGGFGAAGSHKNPLERNVGSIDTSSPDASPVWKITPHNVTDAQLKGHWASGVYDFVRLDPAEHGGRADITWMSGAEHFMWPLARTYATLTPDNTISSIEVSRTLDVKTEAAPFGESTYIPIPVRAATSVIAAQVNGEPVDAIQKRDGTYALEIDRKTTSKRLEVRYWLTPPEDRGTAPAGPRATDTTTFMAPKLSEALELRNDADVAKASKAFTDRLSDVDKADASVMNEYIRNHFHYRYAPFPPHGNKPLTNWADYTNAVFENGKVNCGYAATTLVLQNRLFGNNSLNAVGGFLNNDSPRELQMMESHLWTVDTQGITYDPSPARSLLALRPTKAPESPPTWPWYTFSGLGIAAVGVYLGRNRLRHGASQAASHSKQFVFKVAAPTLQSAHAAAEHAAWSRPGTPYNRRTNRVTHRTAQAGREAFAALKNPMLHSADTLERMKQEAEKIPLAMATDKHPKYMRLAREAISVLTTQEHPALARLAVRTARPAGQRFKGYTGRHAPRRK